MVRNASTFSWHGAIAEVNSETMLSLLTEGIVFPQSSPSSLTFMFFQDSLVQSFTWAWCSLGSPCWPLAQSGPLASVSQALTPSWLPRFFYTAADVLFLNSLSPVTLYTFEMERPANQMRGPKLYWKPPFLTSLLWHGLLKFKVLMATLGYSFRPIALPLAVRLGSLKSRWTSEFLHPRDVLLSLGSKHPHWEGLGNC